MAGTEHLFHELFESLRVLWGPLTSKKWEQQLRQGWKEKYVYCVTNSLAGFGAITNTGLALTPDAPVDQQCVVTPALQKHFKETSFTTCTEQVPSKNRQPLLCMRSVSILAARAGLCMNPSYTTPFWMHVRESQLSSLPSLLAFSDPTTFPLFQKVDEKVSRS